MERGLIIKITTILRSSCFAALLSIGRFASAAQDGFNDEAIIQAFLHDNFDGKSVGMVIGLVDERGSRTFSAGGLDNGTGRKIDGDTVFEIGSVTKTFTALLL
ncbi:MAG: hypothetical protein JWO95_781, partial [Verrucomicrobiales bacterium]|nr:hypothetical protein [Verrucomicrobiales bacterium]